MWTYSIGCVEGLCMRGEACLCTARASLRPLRCLFSDRLPFPPLVLPLVVSVPLMGVINIYFFFLFEGLCCLFLCSVSFFVFLGLVILTVVCPQPTLVSFLIPCCSMKRKERKGKENTSIIEVLPFSFLNVKKINKWFYSF